MTMTMTLVDAKDRKNDKEKRRKNPVGTLRDSGVPNPEAQKPKA